jgi:chromosomal replication initiator protein
MELKKILKAVSEVTDISEKQIISKSRLQEVSLARHLYFYFACKKTNKCLREIGELVKRNHATVIHGQKKISYELEYYPEISHFVKIINLNLKNVDKKWLNYHIIYNNINISHVL